MEPIYLVGNNALTLYLAAKLQSSGENVIIISDKNDNLYLNTNGIALKEDLSLQKQRYTFNTSFITKDKPKLTIVSCDNSKLNYFLSSISISKIKDSPFILFSVLKNISHIEAILGSRITRGYFDGFLNKDDQNVSLFGRAPNITLCPPKKEKNIKEIIPLFEKSGLTTLVNKDSSLGFWEYFAPFAAASLLSAAFNETIPELLVQPDKRETIKATISEISLLALKDGVEVPDDFIEKKICQIPGNYFLPLQASSNARKSGDLTSLSANITNLAFEKKVKIPELNKLIGKIHNLILA